MIGSKVPHIATYRRELPVSLDRLYENALDWEHLPYLHRDTFSSIEYLDGGRDWWRARVGLVDNADPNVLELRLDRDCRRWITRTCEGPGAGNEIWTHAFTVDARRTDVVVDFFVPGIEPDRTARVGAFYQRLYAHLYDEDVSMMTERQVQLDHRGATPTTAADLVIGADDELPKNVEWGGRAFRVVRLDDGEVVAHATVCPHLLGPLGDTNVVDGVVECPWHGYRFDVRTGVNANGHRCRLAPAPHVVVRAN